MDNNTNKHTNNEVVNGKLTSESYNTYSALRNPKQKIDVKSTVLCLVFITALLLSALIFISSIRTAYFNKPSETATEHTFLNKTKSSYDANSLFKFETVTKDISDVFNVPVGVKILNINEETPIATGLRINDIIVKVSGKNITTIDEFNKAINDLSTDDFLIYTVYRNGDYRTISPFEFED
ncbi:MAG: PDZ domain-containing protein [Clostridia bacterium]|nr:PDZ domain-containing protein [Clostridia bacterium]